MNTNTFLLSIGLILCGISLCASDKYVRTPGGLVWSSCVHHVKHDAHIFFDEDDKVTIIEGDSIRSVPKCPKPTIFNRERYDLAQNRQIPTAANRPNDGWQVWTAFNNINNVTFNSFLGYFTTPNTPLNWAGSRAGILYLFTGLQNDNWVPIDGEFPTPPGFDIIQPVIQYGGGSANGGGEYWGLASWYVTVDAGAFWSDELKLNPGDNVFGNMTRVGSNSWYIAGVTPNGTTTAITITRPDLSTQNWAYCTLEVYDIENCDMFPPSGSTCEFTEMSLTGAKNENVEPAWASNNNNENHCNTLATVYSPDAVTISF